MEFEDQRSRHAFRAEQVAMDYEDQRSLQVGIETGDAFIEIHYH